jgi:hypothetical protein
MGSFSPAGNIPIRGAFDKNFVFPAFSGRASRPEKPARMPDIAIPERNPSENALTRV